MKPAVETVFPAFTEAFEGCPRIPQGTPMYVDVLNLVTTGRGNLIDPVEAALPLPWVRVSDGSPASADEVRAEWTRVKTGHFALVGWRAASRGATVVLTQEAVDDLTLAKLHSNDALLRGRFDGWEDLPADVQLAVHSVAWACGPAFRFPRLEAALNARDWATCATECQMSETGNPGLIPRNRADKALFLSALAGGDPDVVNGWTQ